MQQETIHLCLQIERSHWFYFREGRSHLGWKMDIPCCLALSHAFLLVSFAVIHREKTLLLNEPPENSSPANSKCCSITFLATHGCLHLSTYAAEAAARSLFLHWHFDRPMLFACQGFTHRFLLSVLISFPHGSLPQLPWGQGSNRKSTMSYQTEWSSCSRQKKKDY